ncbi:helix-turn-helix domain-containing protein [Corynebacterium meitnerae]|uniref:Helix-turn-helix domain-containing protein n=1 Tax=Corynebacterium meitnerae TaxID=2913498 RepID=A0A9X3LVJ3_9CORY|nr:helix-turn-helix transcriptional regulator [Corynebacterium meitnerae]MCZ9293950.1 helix-turn-helix domain-containing protein [Corynebacterium meitnerae]
MSESIDPYVERASGRESFDEAVGDARWASLGFSMSERLRAIRELRGLSQKRLATVAGLSRTVVSNLERNQHTGSRSSDPTLSTVYRLAYALRVPPAMLLPGVVDELGDVCWERFEPVSLVEMLNLAEESALRPD